MICLNMIQLLTLWKSNLLQSPIVNAWRPIVLEPHVAQIHVQAIILVMISTSPIIFLVLINALDFLLLAIVILMH
uniref:Uncharacterized protein n=1 Tax=Oryza brachyantha TaxID=4533 RepID=J3LZI6_ORYBR